MVEVVNLLEDLSRKFDLLRSDLDSLTRSVLGSRRKKGSVHTSTTPGLGADLGADPRDDLCPVREEGNLGEIHLLVVEAPVTKSSERNR